MTGNTKTVEALLRLPAGTRDIAWDEWDVIHYHLSLGAGVNAADDPELGYTYEKQLQVLPTFATVAGGAASIRHEHRRQLMPWVDHPILEKALHAGTRLRLHQVIDKRATAHLTSRITAVIDKTRAAVVTVTTTARHRDRRMWSIENDFWAAGWGGFGAIAPAPVAPPQWHPPPASSDVQTMPVNTFQSQSLMFRLHGGLSPYHIDPEVARSAGQPRPPLHGLALYGMVAKALISSWSPSRPDHLASLTGRFNGVVLPGEILKLRTWPLDSGVYGYDMTRASAEVGQDRPVMHGTATMTPACLSSHQSVPPAVLRESREGSATDAAETRL